MKHCITRSGNFCRTFVWMGWGSWFGDAGTHLTNSYCLCICTTLFPRYDTKLQCDSRVCSFVLDIRDLLKPKRDLPFIFCEREVDSMWLGINDLFFHLIPRYIVANSSESRIPQLRTQKTQTHPNSSTPIPLNSVT
jgi:hypothetical protein